MGILFKRQEIGFYRLLMDIITNKYGINIEIFT